jgi:hypothetical protein
VLPPPRPSRTGDLSHGSAPVVCTSSVKGGENATGSPPPGKKGAQAGTAVGLRDDLFNEEAHRRKGVAYDRFLVRMRTLREIGFRRFATGVNGGNRAGSKHVLELGFLWWDSTRITVAGRPPWLNGRPWHRIGDRVLQERR